VHQYIVRKVSKVNIWYISKKEISQYLKISNNITRNNKCLILGNGPSLNKTSLISKRDTDFYACNYFYKHELYHSLNIVGYFMLDPWLNDDKGKKQLEIIIESLKHKRLKYFIIHKTLFEKLPILKNLDSRIIPVTPTIEIKPGNIRFGFPKVQHTPILPLYLAIFSYSKIDLLGLDHTALKLFAQGQNLVNHFYDEKREQQQSLEGEKWYKRVISTGITFQQYLIISEYAKCNGVDINNLSPDSDLEMFKKV